MLQYDFYSHDNKNNAACTFSARLIGISEYCADFEPGRGNDKRNRSYAAGGGLYAHVQQRKRYAGCKCVYACCNRKRKHNAD